jgi:hypothetical protein
MKICDQNFTLILTPTVCALLLGLAALSGIHLGRTLGASEAYTAMAAGQPTYADVVRYSLRFDPGKPPLHALLVHGFTVTLGHSETVLRLPSLLFTLLTVALFIGLGNEMFGPAVGIAAAVLWGLNPLSIVFEAWARMYAMFVALSVAQLLLLWQLRSRPGAGRTIACGLLGAAMLYTHLGAALFLGAEAAIMMGASWRGERNRTAWAAVLLAAILFLPFLPIASRQIHGLIAGHWVDWIGPAHRTSPIRRAVTLIIAAALSAMLAFGPRVETDEREPIRWCAAIGLIPIIALVAGSIAIRPMFTIRYVAPSCAVLILLLGALLARLRQRRFRLATAGIATFLVCLFPYYPWKDSWRDMARVVSLGPPGEPVFFESGYVFSAADQDDPQQGFPQGFFRVPFDWYFSGANPRMTIDPSAPAAARQIMAAAATANHGAWLVSGLSDEKARAEMPADCFEIEKNAGSSYANLYHLVPFAGCHNVVRH